MTEPATAAPTDAYIVSHTHWDREWYLTFPRFRVALTRIVRGVLDALENDPDFEHFCLDGQAIVLEDHLAIHSEDEPRIRALAEAGKLSLGPWYILPDEFLISRESTVRNLLLGHRVASRYGPVQRVGYMPDSFGHIAQVPQILRQAGMDSFVYTRGNGSEIDEVGCLYDWAAPDGSTVLAVNQVRGYCNAAGLGFDEIWHAHTQRDVKLERAVEQVRELFGAMSEQGGGDVVLLNNGCDHFPVQQEFGTVLTALREAYPHTTFRHTNLQAFVDAVREHGAERKRFEGELAGGRLHHILSGVWSARMPLKQWNDRCQTLLSGCWEPLEAYAHFALGRPYADGLLEHAWKKLLENHPHDSICGCSIDEVHRDMEPRFREVEETADAAMGEQLRALLPTFARKAEDDGETALCVFNPLPQSQRRVVERLVVLQPGEVDHESLAVVDDDGNSVPMEITEVEHVERFWGIDYRQTLWCEDQRARFETYKEQMGARILKLGEDQAGADRFVHLRFLADLPPVGHARYRLASDMERADPPTDESVQTDGNRIENDVIAVVLHPDGTLDLEDKRTGRTHTGLNVLESTEDIGDEYDYSPAEESRTITSRGVDGIVTQVEFGALRATLEASFLMELPPAIDPSRRKRLDGTVACPVNVRVTLEAGSAVVDIDVSFVNHAADHRLRALFKAAIETDHLVSDGHFYENVRSLDLPADDDWVQPHPGTFPQQDFSLVQDDDGGLAVLNRGLPEVACTREEGGTTIALTLLRSVGWLSRDDFPTRRHSNAGPTIPTPDAQCLGAQRFRYALMPFTGSHPHAPVRLLSERWRTPTPVVQGVMDRAFASNPGLLTLSAEFACVTAIKKHVERETLVVRVFNPASESDMARLALGPKVRQAWHVDLLEQRAKEVEALREGHVEVFLKPHEIATVEIELEAPTA
ncbi:MAG: glycoside hydrolase family 38 C-terminal domain-containing protein [Planctomycetota bacterium]|nr:glycoside hydrolase family 38 C-terminal domain-containing protein [Planctomycetota bacterium]